MNILPKKRWHVRTKENIARVRRDEAEAAEKERIRLEKQEYAESEARLNILRSKAKVTCSTESAATNAEKTTTGTITAPDGHVDLFSDFESHIKTSNKEHEKEKKEEQEKYEKQIGYLTYLGQDTNEALKLRSWYEIAPKRAEVGDEKIIEKDLKKKYLHDPLTLIKELLPEEKFVTPAKTTSIAKVPIDLQIEESTPNKSHKSKKLKKHKKQKKAKKKSKKDDKYKSDNEKLKQTESHKKDLIDRLRRERLKREARERARQEAFLCPKVEKPKVSENSNGGPRIVQKYNSQFNPELAKQNMA